MTTPQSELVAFTHPRGCLVERCQLETMSMVICPGHWNLLPNAISGAVWDEYTAGYAKGTHPTNAYRAALRWAVAWLESNTEIPTG